MIKNILFDLDGTLADSEELIIKSFQHIYITQLSQLKNNLKSLKL